MHLWAFFMEETKMILRTISKALEYIKQIDPETDVTEYMIRKLAQQGKVSQVQTGIKTLVDVESVIKYLSGEDTEVVIRKIS